MSCPTPIEDRLIQLEKQSRRLRAGFTCVIIAGACMFGLGWTQAGGNGNERTVTATRFVLIDQSGRQRAILGSNGGKVGLYVLPATPRSPNSELVFVGVNSVEKEPDVEYGSIALGNEITPKVNASISANHIGLYDDEEELGVKMELIKMPRLEFVDRSGAAFVDLMYDPKSGTRFEVRAPLGIKDAWFDAVKASAQNEPIDPRFDEMYGKSLRLDVGAPPFSAPFIRLWKDGELIWSAK